MKFIDKLMMYGETLRYTSWVSDNNDFCEGFLIRYTNGVLFTVLCKNGDVVSY